MRGLIAVRELIEAALAVIAACQPCRVDAVRVRLGSSLAEEALRRGFELLAAGTLLDGADLEIEAVRRFVECPCGRISAVSANDLLGYRWICMVCGHAEEIDERDDLELLQVTVSPLATVEAAPSGRR